SAREKACVPCCFGGRGVRRRSRVPHRDARGRRAGVQDGAVSASRGTAEEGEGLLPSPRSKRPVRAARVIDFRNLHQANARWLAGGGTLFLAGMGRRRNGGPCRVPAGPVARVTDDPGGRGWLASVMLCTVTTPQDLDERFR